jgi:hypothetical protein
MTRAVREHNASVLRMVGIDPDKLTPAEIKKAADLVGQASRCDYVPGATARRPKAIAALDAFVAAHPEARLRRKAP